MTKNLLIFQLLFVLFVFCEVKGSGNGIKRRTRSKAEYQQRYANLKETGGKLFTNGFSDDSPWQDYFVGTPPKYHTMNVETGFNNIWFIDPSYPIIDSYQRVYDPTESTTSQYIEDNYKGYSGIYKLHGPKYIDVVYDYSKNAWNQTFGTIQRISSNEVNISIPVDGILGLAYNLDEDFNKLTENSSPLLHLLKNSTQKLLSVWQSRKIMDEIIFSDSFIGFGFTDYTLCDQDITYVKVKYDSISHTLLSFHVEGFKIDDYKTNTKELAKVDTGVPVIYVPNRPYRAIYRKLNPEYNWDLHVFVTDCANSDVFPDWVFTIGGRDFVLTAKDYMLDIFLPGDKCILTFESSVDIGADYIIGNPFLRTYCSIYDLDNGKLGLTNALQPVDDFTPPPFLQ